EEAIALAASEDIEGQAAAQVGLAEVMVMLGNPSEAVNLLDEAQVNYQQLGDSERVEALQQRSLTLADSNR
ncbi:MAG TPA: hypothetical protein DCL61_06485, partial [Cyanobacteria bacterium UBA12227]|nr:hypothetical protein [Cyanobacteria bacterium UBA12227]